MVEPGQSASGSNALVSSRVSSIRLRSGPSAVSRSPSRTRLMPERARRSASASACSGSRNAVGGSRRRPKNRARAALAEGQPAVLDGHEPALAGRRRQQERDVERALGRDRSGRGHGQPVAGLVGDVVRRPRAGRGVGRGRDADVVDADRADRVQLLELEDRPDRARRHARRWPRRLARGCCPPRRKIVAACRGPGNGLPKSSRKKNAGRAPPAPRRPEQRTAIDTSSAWNASTGRASPVNSRDLARLSSTAADESIAGEDPARVPLGDPAKPGPDRPARSRR